MLRELHISNLAIIEDVHVELDDALTVFTGATGAGKSLVIGALQFLLGMKSPGQMLRPGATEGRVSGVFVVTNSKARQELSELADVAIDEPDVLITRRLLSGGRGTCSINGQPVTVSMLQQMGERLVDIHGQYEHQFLLSPSNQLLVLDTFAGCESLADEAGQAWRAWEGYLSQRQDLGRSEGLRRQQLELYEYQAVEIDQAAIRPGELEEVEARHRRLANIDRIRQMASAVLAGMEDESGVLDPLRGMVKDLDELTGLDARLAAVGESCKTALITLDEAAGDLRRYVDGLDLDEGELAEVDSRLALLRRLCGKYGGDIEGVLAHRTRIEEEIRTLRQQQEDWSRIDELIEASKERFNAVAKRLAAKRRSAAKKLNALVNPQLGELGMEKAAFEMRLSECDPGSTGCDAAEMMVQTNPGQPMLPLRKIASGGELSRIMLAIKTALAGTDRSSVMVFDEVDAHVGGRLGAIIGEKLRQLAQQHQVICITHLPQIAAYATRHLKVQKASENDETRSVVRVIDGRDRIEELAEMIAGPERTPTSLRQAKELLDRAGT